MITLILIACALVAVTVVVHAVGFSVLLRFTVKEWQALTKSGFWSLAWLIIWLTYWLLLIHLAEIALWGLFYFWKGCMPDVGTACYFSGITYTTVGYGDLVLPEAWRMLAPLEAMTGILMCGLSTGLFFAVVHRLITDLGKEKLSSKPKEPPVIHDR